MRQQRLGHTLILCLFILLTATDSLAVQIMSWERIPLAIPLNVGHERVVFVDQNVRVGLPPDVVSKLRVQSTGGALYLHAFEPIPPTRLQLQNVSNGEIMLVDIVATTPEEGQVALEPVKIVVGAQPSPQYGKAPSSVRATADTRQADEEVSQAPSHETPIPVVLSRYAAQMLYAPLRTVEPVAGITQVSTERNLDLSTLMPQYPIDASAIGTWKLGTTYVSAVKLRNTGPNQIKLDARDLVGAFVTATFMHPYLGPMGNPTDTTTVFLVTEQKLKQSVLPSISQVDPRGLR